MYPWYFGRDVLRQFFAFAARGATVAPDFIVQEMTSVAMLQVGGNGFNRH
jgi:hypothetical protein